MKFELKRAVALSLFSLTVGAGVVGCADSEPSAAPASETSVPSATAVATTPAPTVEATVAPTAEPVAEATDAEKAASAKVAMDQILEQVKAEFPPFRSQVTEDMPEEAIVAQIEKSFPNTLSHLKLEAFDPTDRYEVVDSLSQFYMIDPNTDAESEASDFKIKGNTATVTVGDFDVWLGGKVEGQTPTSSGNPSVLTMTFEGGRWVISDFDSGI